MRQRYIISKIHTKWWKMDATKCEYPERQMLHYWESQERLPSRGSSRMNDHSSESESYKFNSALQEYLELEHAELIPSTEISVSVAYYLPVHGVFKSSSTTTKVWPVFDASAKSSNGVSLNDILETDPNLYPLLTDVLIRFRVHRIGFSADISKMFREVLLHEQDPDLHRFLLRGKDGRIADHRMRWLTFGLKPSPFLDKSCNTWQNDIPAHTQKPALLYCATSMWMITYRESTVWKKPDTSGVSCVIFYN